MTRRQVFLAGALAAPLSGQQERFRGTWTLVSYEQHKADGSASYPLGKDPVGRLFYDADGRMWVQLMRRDRPLFVSRTRQQGTADEIRAAFEGFLAYYGPYKINEKENTVIHHVECCSFPNWVGTDQVRRFEFAGGRLILYAPGDYKLVWARAA